MSKGEIFIEMRDIVKLFPDVRAPGGVSFDVREGEVHSLCGENGAGRLRRRRGPGALSR